MSLRGHDENCAVAARLDGAGVYGNCDAHTAAASASGHCPQRSVWQHAIRWTRPWALQESE